MKLDLATVRELLTEYHYDRRNRVYDFMTQLRPEEFVRDVHAGWGSIRTTLLHCLEAEEFWVGYAVQQQARPDFDPADYPNVAAIRALADKVRRQTESFVARLTEADMARECAITYSSGTRVTFPMAKMFLHVITHDTHHRGQALVLARQMGYEPPEIDLM
ncbi:MAG: DinB family protein [Mycobacterium leprae]